ncbi:cuticle protein 14-like [Tachypleus tridentatus]|uniref:cuticle protein 14-like n=1 Tax=Tachypleus tridentatus TaxID=6853 RepID=UPI003FD6901C
MITPTLGTQSTMKILILCALVAATQAGLIYSPHYLEAGGSTQFRNQDNVGNYHFGYNEGHTSGSTFRRESGDAYGNKVGSYGLRDADGRVRLVNYVADAAGFRTNIQSNEPGVEPKDPANTSINKAVVAPITYAAAAPALTYAAAPAPAHVAHPTAYNYVHGLGYYGRAHLGAAPYYNYGGYLW